MGAKDKEQCEGGTRNSWRDGKETKEWRDKEQCDGGTGNNGREGQGTVGGKLREQWEGNIRNSEEGTRNSGRDQ